MGARWDTVSLSDGRSLEVAVQGADEGELLNLPSREPRGRPAVRAVPSRRRRARHRARVPIPSRVRRVQPAGGQDGRQRGGGRSGTRGPPRSRAIPDGGMVGRRPARPRVRGAAPGPRAGRRLDRGRGAVRRRGPGLDRRDGGGQPVRVPAGRARSRPRPRVDGAADRGDVPDRAGRVRAQAGLTDVGRRRSQVTGAFGEYLAGSFRSAFRDGPWGWYDDDLAFVGDWGLTVADIRVPVSVWQGREDRFVPITHGEWLAGHIPGARAHLRPGAWAPVARRGGVRGDPRRSPRGVGRPSTDTTPLTHRPGPLGTGAMLRERWMSDGCDSPMPRPCRGEVHHAWRCREANTA